MTIENNSIFPQVDKIIRNNINHDFINGLQVHLSVVDQLRVLFMEEYKNNLEGIDPEDFVSESARRFMEIRFVSFKKEVDIIYDSIETVQNLTERASEGVIAISKIKNMLSQLDLAKAKLPIHESYADSVIYRIEVKFLRMHL